MDSSFKGRHRDWQGKRKGTPNRLVDFPRQHMNDAAEGKSLTARGITARAITARGILTRAITGTTTGRPSAYVQSGWFPCLENNRLPTNHRRD